MQARGMKLVFLLVFVCSCCCQYVATSCGSTNYNLEKLQYDPNDSPPEGYNFTMAGTTDTISINFCAQVASSTGCTSTESLPAGACHSSGTSTTITGNAMEVSFTELQAPFTTGSPLLHLIKLVVPYKSGMVQMGTLLQRVLFCFIKGE